MLKSNDSDSYNYDQNSIIIPTVDSEFIIPKIRIYDPNNGNFWYREIGFTSKFFE